MDEREIVVRALEAHAADLERRAARSGQNAEWPAYAARQARERARRVAEGTLAPYDMTNVWQQPGQNGSELDPAQRARLVHEAVWLHESGYLTVSAATGISVARLQAIRVQEADATDDEIARLFAFLADRTVQS